MRVAFLGSGSAGNATAVTSGATTILIDCGFSARRTTERLEHAGIAPADVAAMFITHEHTDHVSGIDVYARRRAPGVAVHMTEGTARACRHIAASLEGLALIAPDTPVRIGCLTVRAFRTAHDAADPVGYIVEDDAGVSFGLATDTGHLTPEASEALANCHLLGLETNHDLEMLRTGPYPTHVKRRIASEHGHLSNPDAASALERLAHDDLAFVAAVHVSRTNNTASLAGECLRTRARAIGLGAKVVTVAQERILVIDTDELEPATSSGSGTQSSPAGV